MGVQDLFASIAKLYPECVKYISLSDMRGKRIVIDGNLVFKKHWSVQARNHIDSLHTSECVNPESILISTMKSMMAFINTLIKHSITPVFVFDGGMQKEKQETCDERRRLINEAKDKLKLLMKKQEDEVLLGPEDEKEINTLRKRVSSPTEEHRKKMRDVLTCLGITSLVSKTDGEKLCCSLYLEDKVDGVFSDDSDCLPFGCCDLYRKVDKVEINGNDGVDTESPVSVKVFSSISLIELLNTLNLSMDQFVDVCILCGCDYSKRVKGFSLAKSIREIQTHGNIEEVIKNNPNRDFSQCNYQTCREIYRYTPSEDLTNDPLISLDLGSYDLDVLSDYPELSFELSMFRNARAKFNNV